MLNMINYLFKFSSRSHLCRLAIDVNRGLRPPPPVPQSPVTVAVPTASRRRRSLTRRLRLLLKTTSPASTVAVNTLPHPDRRFYGCIQIKCRTLHHVLRMNNESNASENNEKSARGKEGLACTTSLPFSFLAFHWLIS